MDLNKGGFIILTIVQIPSFYCAICLFVRYAQRTSPLRRLQNHLLMCLLIVATWTISIELASTQKYLWSASALIHTSWFCSFWNISFLSTAALNRALMAFMCVERHFLVFRPQTYHTHRSRLFFHYIPLTFIVSIILIYLFITNIFISCPQMNFNYSRFMCGYTCSVLLGSLGLVHAWILVFFPTVITIIGCVLLPIRFIIQKRQLQRVQWHRARKMIIQTSMIASVYTICWLPYTIMLHLLIYNLLSFTEPHIALILTIIPYITSLVTPFIVFHTTQRAINVAIIVEIKRRFFPRRQGVVRPLNNVVAQQHNPSARENHTSARQLQIIKNALSHSFKS